MFCILFTYSMIKRSTPKKRNDNGHNFAETVNTRKKMRNKVMKDKEDKTYIIFFLKAATGMKLIPTIRRNTGQSCERFFHEVKFR